MDRLAVCKALGDDTRYAVYADVARESAPVATAEIAERLGLHPNTVRAHLDRLREVGLVDLSIDAHGAVGRPAHRWAVAASAPALGLEPSAFRLLAHLLAEAVAKAGLSADDLRAVARLDDRPAADGRTHIGLQSVVEGQADLGFDPVVTGDGDLATIAFVRCPFRELAAAFPDVICELHRGVTESIADAARMDVCRFDTLVDEHPCRVELSAAR